MSESKWIVEPTERGRIWSHPDHSYTIKTDDYSNRVIFEVYDGDNEKIAETNLLGIAQDIVDLEDK